jgi:phosphate:Na+ symporter
MATHSVLLDLAGAIALLIWATRMVRTGVLRGFETPLRRLLARATHPVTALAAGIGAATALQSSTATALLLVSFAERGLIALGPAYAVMLGADVGSTLVVQAMALDLKAVVPVLLVAGVALFLNGREPRTRQVGRILIGLALMIVALAMVVAASAPLTRSPVLGAVLAAAASDPLAPAAVAALLTWIVHSSVAVVLLLAALATAGVVGPDAIPALVLGVNLGAGLIPLGLAAGTAVEGRRVLAGNLCFRALGAIAGLASLGLWIGPWTALALPPALSVAVLHTAFNVVLAAVFLPFVGPAARLAERLLPAPPETASEAEAGPRHLDPALLDTPAQALGAASREVLRLADRVEAMLADAILAFEDPPRLRPEEVSGRDDAIDRLEEEIRLYLTAVSRRALSEEEARRCFDLIVFTSHLENVGDIIDKSLMLLADKKARRGVHFTEEGWRELVALHRTVLEQMRLAVTVFVTRDAAMARDLVSRKDSLRALERDAVRRHLDRLRGGSAQAIDSSSVHLDVIRDLKSINAHVASVAYPILEAAGVLRASRLEGG